jgi:hypothetical protein
MEKFKRSCYLVGIACFTCLGSLWVVNGLGFAKIQEGIFSTLLTILAVITLIAIAFRFDQKVKDARLDKRIREQGLTGNKLNQLLSEEPMSREPFKKA